MAEPKYTHARTCTGQAMITQAHFATTRYPDIDLAGSKGAMKQESKEARKQGSKEARKQGEAREQGSKEARKHKSKDARTQGIRGVHPIAFRCIPFSSFACYCN